MDYQSLEISFTITLIAVSVILILINLIFASGTASQVAYFLFTIALAQKLDWHPLQIFMTCIVIWGVFQFFDRLIWTRLAKHVRTKYILPFWPKQQKGISYDHLKSIEEKHCL